MNEKFIRLLLVIVGIAGLAGFGWKMFDYWNNQEQIIRKMDFNRIREQVKAVDAKKGPTHLKPYSQYAVLQDLNITGYVAPPELPEELEPVVEKPVLAAEDVEVPLIQSPNAAWVQARGEKAAEDDFVGQFLVVGEVFELKGKEGLKIRLKAVQPGWVELELVESGEIIKVHALTYEVDSAQIYAAGPNQGGSGNGEGNTDAAVSVVPDYTKELSEANSFAVGKKDVEALESMSQEEILSSIPHRVQRDPLSNEPIGLRIKSVPANSVFERLGLRADDIVLDVNGQSATNRDELFESMKQLDTDLISVRIERLGGVRTLTYRLPR
ncbi:MAG: PDZ domain-containing protein [Planctomycetota bacterium]|nr:PDZ domain-containing protein [Planctomycetota bacterium]